MAQPELDRQVRQHGNDIDSLYELTAEIKTAVDEHSRVLGDIQQEQEQQAAKLDALDSKVDEGFRAILARLEQR